MIASLAFAAGLVGGLLGAGALAGCTTLGGNIKGDFACRAPDGICAPSATIDDQALALISGEDGDRLVAPQVPTSNRQLRAAVSRRHRPRCGRASACCGSSFPPRSTPPGGFMNRQPSTPLSNRVIGRKPLPPVRSQPRAKTSLPPPGRIRCWPPSNAPILRLSICCQSTAAYPAPRPWPSPGPKPAPPGPASTDPVGDIKDQVTRTLLTPRGTPTALPPAKRAPTAAANVTPAQAAQPASGAASASSIRSQQPAPRRQHGASIAVPKFATPEGKAAIAAVAANPAIRAGLDRGESEANMAAQNPAVPMLRAAPFPGLQP